MAAVYEYLNLAFLLDATGVYIAVRDLSRHGARSFAQRLPLVMLTPPSASRRSALAARIGLGQISRSEATIEVTDLRHPLVNDAVPNSIALRPGRGVLVTGSNMSGKSTFLRTVGVNAILAQTINTCLARSTVLPYSMCAAASGGRTISSRARAITSSKSRRFSNSFARAMTAPHLFLLDELFRGTNAVERIAAGQAVLQQLLLEPKGGTKPHVVLAATHDRELVDLASEMFDAYHFGDSIGPDGLMFDHRLQQGPATTRNAIALLRLHGAPETLLTQAVTTAEMLDRQRGTSLVAR